MGWYGMVEYCIIYTNASLTEIKIGYDTTPLNVDRCKLYSHANANANEDAYTNLLRSIYAAYTSIHFLLLLNIYTLTD